MIEAWVYNFADDIKHSMNKLVQIQKEKLEEEKKQTELLKQIAEQINK